MLTGNKTPPAPPHVEANYTHFDLRATTARGVWDLWALVIFCNTFNRILSPLVGVRTYVYYFYTIVSHPSSSVSLLSTFVVCFHGVNAIFAVLLNVADVICGKVLCVDEG